MRGVFQSRKGKKKWKEMDISLKEYTIFFVKVSSKKKDGKQVELNLPSCIVTPASEKEVGKEFNDRGIKITEKYSNLEHYFIVNSKQERTEWLEVLTLCCLCLTKDGFISLFHFFSFLFLYFPKTQQFFFLFFF